MHFSRHLALSLGLLATLFMTSVAQAQTAIAIGGALRTDNDAVWQRIVDEAGGPGARFAVFATAAGNPERSAGLIVAALNRRGAAAEAIPIAPNLKGADLAKNLRDPELLAKVRAARGIFFSGGAQELIVDTLLPGGEPTEMLLAIRAVIAGGGVVAGTSAGAAVMSRMMFRDAQDNHLILKGQWRAGKEYDRGLGFVGPDLFVDQHFLKRGRIGRILPAMRALGFKRGLGVEENSAIVVKGDEVEVIGARGALLVDLSEATSDAVQPAFNLRGAVLSYLDHGDRHNLKTGLSTPAVHKLREPKIDPSASDYKPYLQTDPYYLDILGDQTIANAMAQLLDSAQPELRGLAFRARPRAGDPAPDLGFEFRLYKGAGTVGWFSGALGGEDYTVLRVRLDVIPVRMSTPLFTPLLTPL
jgi:cyanophycinase